MAPLDHVLCPRAEPSASVGEDRQPDECREQSAVSSRFHSDALVLIGESGIELREDVKNRRMTTGTKETSS